jgi:hypothetical protein
MRELEALFPGVDSFFGDVAGPTGNISAEKYHKMAGKYKKYKAWRKEGKGADVKIEVETP